GAPAYIWPGGGITMMVDVTRVPANGFGYVPTPALVAPIEFTMRLEDYAALGGHLDRVQKIETLARTHETSGGEIVMAGRRAVAPHDDNPWPAGSVR
ncbi:MAG: hypothetical protein WD711_12225, partial [Dongiaceae bacterium]